MATSWASSVEQPTPAPTIVVTDSRWQIVHLPASLQLPNPVDAGKVPVIDGSTQLMRTQVGCALTFEVDDHVVLALQVAAASSTGSFEIEQLAVTLDGQAVAVEEVQVEHGGRVHLIRCGAGQLAVDYHAIVRRALPADQPPTLAERLFAVRPSRYCPSDLLEAFAEAELNMPADLADRGRMVGDWVSGRLRYELGSSGPFDTAVDTLLAGRGVCRDFAHLTVALCRTVGVPARLASVYAPGVFPMDFHAVAEVATPDRWEVVDATRLAPRQSLVRIATGRDAGDTAFSTTLDGSAELITAGVTAFVHGDLPIDDITSAVTLP
ncbi:MAG: transglutaminase family protein [Ilumatobacteraceae bacterium]|nr:transglutaminase family protein [Ilumatobacteraceae bacterium]